MLERRAALAYGWQQVAGDPAQVSSTALEKYSG
jgi:hypothetical protein